VLNPAMDFLSSSISTFICSIISTPQMVLTDRIMAGVYEHFLQAICWIYKTEGNWTD
jgi:solute carrier family 25 S-adenosylmethionine transporter 26